MNKGTPSINIKSLTSDKIRALRQSFDDEDVTFGEEITVICAGKKIYQKTVNKSDLKKNSPKFSGDEYVIDLKDHQIDCNDEISSKSYIKKLFDEIVFFFISGYLELEEKYLMDILYICLTLDFQRPTWLEKLTIKINKKYYNKLWGVLLLIFNDFMKPQYALAAKLMQANPQFLIDQNDQTIFSQNYLKFQSLEIVSNFLKTLIETITQKGKYELDTKGFRLVSILLKYYIYSRQQDPSQYSIKKVVELAGDKIGAQIMFGMKETSVDQLIEVVKKKEKDAVSQRAKINREREELQEQIREMEQKIRKFNPKGQSQEPQRNQQSNENYRMVMKESDLSMDYCQPSFIEPQQQRQYQQQRQPQQYQQQRQRPRSPSPPPAKFTKNLVQQKIVHHPQSLPGNESKNQICQCPLSVTLPCGHRNCLNCSYQDLQRYDFKTRSVEENKVRCLQSKYKGNSCQQLWDTAHYDQLGQLLSQFFG